MLRKFRIFMVFLIAFTTVALISQGNVNGFTMSDSGQSGYKPGEEIITELDGAGSHLITRGVTKRSGVEYAQQVNLLSMKTGENAKLVTWSVAATDGFGFTRTTVANIAKDYERKHPGWSVVGGINGDQYYFSFGELLGVDGSDYFQPQPYYPMIADYQKWFSVWATPKGTGNIVGITNDGSVDQLLYYNAGWNYNASASDKAKIAGFYLTVIRDGVVVQKFPIEKLNEEPGANESSVYSPLVVGYNQIPALNVTGNNVFYVGKTDLAYVSNSKTYTYKAASGNNENAFFGKGTITQTGTSFSVSKGKFAIKTNNQELINFLKVDDEVIAQYEFEGPLNEVESAIGFHTVQRRDDKDVTSNAAYNTQLYPRSVFGRKADGTLVLLAVDGRQASSGMNGVTGEETNAILKHYGVVEAYQVDGGGSVTMITRQGDSFVTVNSPSDGYDRSVLNALLFVVKDVEVDTTFEVKTNEILVNVEELNPTYDKLFIKLNGKTEEVKNGVARFDNLEPNTSYKYEYYTLKGETLTKEVKTGFVSTSKRIPTVTKVTGVYLGDSKINFQIAFDDPDEAIATRKINLGSIEQSFSGNSTIVTVNDLFDMSQLSVELRFDLNDGKGRQGMTYTDFLVVADSYLVIGSVKYKIEEKVKGIYD